MNTLMPFKKIKHVGQPKFGTALTLTFGSAYSKLSVIYYPNYSCVLYRRKSCLLMAVIMAY